MRAVFLLTVRASIFVAGIDIALGCTFFGVLAAVYWFAVEGTLWDARGVRGPLGRALGAFSRRYRLCLVAVRSTLRG